MDLSIIIPVYNEGRSIIPLLNSIEKVLSGIKISYEILFINDGSTDSTYATLNKIKSPKVKPVHFIRNFGKSAALRAGFSKAIGNLVMTMDGDLEDDPSEIPRFLKAAKDYDMVVGWRHRRRHTAAKRFFSHIYNHLINFTTGLKIHDSNCGFKIMKKEVMQNLNIYGELHRYIPTIAKLAGFKIGEIKIGHKNRIYGKSKYGNIRIVRGFLDLLTINFLLKYAYRPLHFFGLVGFSLFLVGIAGVVALYIRKMFWGILISTTPYLFMLAVLFSILGVQFISIGLLGEMMIRNSSKKDYIEKK